MQYEICVTQEDIARGSRGDKNSCPIALALERFFPKADSISVTSDLIQIDCNNYQASEQVIAFVEAFDNECDVMPLTFTLQIPVPDCVF